MKKIVFLLIALLLSDNAFASFGQESYDDKEFDIVEEKINDPFEKLNRKTFAFNKGVNNLLLKPVNKIYRSVTPTPVRNILHNILQNLTEPLNFLNALLQGNHDKASKSLGRFLMNSTWGLLGASDVAAYAGIKYEKMSFGKSTLKSYGVKSGPYIILPIIGPSSFRDSIGYGADVFMDPIKYTIDKSERELRLSLDAIDTFDNSIDTLESIEKTSLDDYAAIRNIYMQKYR
jgi:phospholipid-binding lipoprotein MlaA